MAGILDMIKQTVSGNNNQNNNQQQNSNQNNNQNKPSDQSNGVTTGGSADGANTNANDSGKEKNPLDVYSAIFDNKDNKDAAKAPSFSIPEDKLKEVAKQLDFTKGLDPELLKKALAGDTTALMEAINHAGRSSYETSISHLSQLSDQFITSRLDFDSKSFGSKVSEQMTNTELAKSTANFNHPVVKAELVAKAKELAKAFPDASPEEIANKARDYVTQLANAINPAKESAEEKEKAGNVDWDNYLG